jgi:hypothetical protein
MSLRDYQIALGLAVRRGTQGKPNSLDATYLQEFDLRADERDSLLRLDGSPGFQLTITIARSWAEGRAVKAAPFTLAIIPHSHRAQILQEWVSGGASTNSFFAAESEAFLSFVAERLTALPDVLQICRIEQAAQRTKDRSLCFTPRDTTILDRYDVVLKFGDAAVLVEEPVEDAATSGDARYLLFAPGLPELFRICSPVEKALLELLQCEMDMVQLRDAGHPEGLIRSLYEIGALDAVLEEQAV